MQFKNRLRVATLYLMVVAIALSILLRSTHLDTRVPTGVVA